MYIRLVQGICILASIERLSPKHLSIIQKSVWPQAYYCTRALIVFSLFSTLNEGKSHKQISDALL